MNGLISTNINKAAEVNIPSVLNPTFVIGHEPQMQSSMTGNIND